MSISSLKRRSSCPDLQRLNAVDLNSISKVDVSGISGFPCLMLLKEDGGCAIYIPDKGKVYSLGLNLSGFELLANSGNWFLVIDSLSKLLLIDSLSGQKIHLPPLESRISTSTHTANRLRSKNFQVRGLLWVDETSDDYVVAWYLDSPTVVSFCKKGDDHYTDIPLRAGVPRLLTGLCAVVLSGYRLYIIVTRYFTRIIDLSGKQGCFKDLTDGNPETPYPGGWMGPFSIAVTRAGEVLVVKTDENMNFRIFKNVPNPDPNPDQGYIIPRRREVHSIGDEAIFLDLGTTVPANHTLGIKPNSIYFTRHNEESVTFRKSLDICVFDLATKTIKMFSFLDGMMNLKDAQWFLPRI